MVKQSGFTLIELLIVVAIISILAAIAVPNFLEAQVRAKVARVQAEFTTLATAIEAFHVDQGHYPADYYPYSLGCLPRIANVWDLDVTLGVLTTPVSYLSALPLIDPFNQDGGSMMTGKYMYVNDAEHEYWGSACGKGGVPRYRRIYKPTVFGDRWFYWLLKSYGPDRQVEWWVGEFMYDASNGTISRGEIERVGP